MKLRKISGWLVFGGFCLVTLIVGIALGASSGGAFLPTDDPAYCYDMQTIAQTSDPTEYRNVHAVGQTTVPTGLSVRLFTWDPDGNLVAIEAQDDVQFGAFFLQDVRTDVSAEYVCTVYRITNYEGKILEELEADVCWEQTDSEFRVEFDRKFLNCCYVYSWQLEKTIEIQYLVRLTNL